MLAIVDDQQQMLALEGRLQTVDRGCRTVEVDAQGAGDDGGHQLRIGKRRKLREPYAVGIVGDHAGAGLDREPRLADAARARQRHQAMSLQTGLDLFEIGFPADQCSRLTRKIVGNGDGRRRRGSHVRGRRSAVFVPRDVRAIDRSHEAVAAPGDGEDAALVVARRTQHLAQRRDVDVQIVLFHQRSRATPRR